MSLIVNNVVSASSNISYSYLANSEIFGYVISLTYEIKIQDVQFDNNDGVLLSGRSALRAAYKQRNITARIAGDEILNGLITSLSFPEGSLNGEEIAQVQIEERRRLSDYSSKSFSKYIPSPHLLADFSENYNFQRSGSTYSYSRSISIQYNQDIGNQFLTNAKVFLTNYYYENRPSIGYYEDGISENAKFDKGYNGVLTEEIDLINLSVSLEENFESSFIDAANNVSKIIKTSEGISQRGYLTKDITIDLTALRLDSSNVLESAMGTVIDEVISNETSFGDPHTISKGISKDNNKASVTISFSTDPELSQNQSVTYSCSKQKNGNFTDYSLQVNYKSKGKNVSNRYNKTIDLWESQRDNNESKITSLFSEAVNIYEKSRSANISRSEGTISETIVYTDQSDYDSESLDDGILKYQITVSKDQKVPRSRKIVDIKNLKEKLLTSSLETLGKATVTATVVASPDYGQFFGKEYLLNASREADMNNALEETTYYGVSDQISIDMLNGATTRVIQYIIA